MKTAATAAIALISSDNVLFPLWRWYGAPSQQNNAGRYQNPNQWLSRDVVEHRKSYERSQRQERDIELAAMPGIPQCYGYGKKRRRQANGASNQKQIQDSVVSFVETNFAA